LAFFSAFSQKTKQKKNMQIYIKSMQGILGGKQFHVTLLNDKVTIKVLKKKIVAASAKQCLPTQLDAQVLQVEFNDEILDDNRTVAYYGIKDNDYVYISMHSSGSYVTIIVSAKEANITVGGLLLSDSILKLKETIDEICPGLKPPAVSRKITFRSKVCSDEATLEESKISEGVQINLK